MKSFLLAPFLALYTFDVNARAGGGGGHSGGGGGGHFSGGYYGSHGGDVHWTESDTYALYIILFSIPALTFIIYKSYRWVILYKNAKANKLLMKAALVDKAWEKEQLTAFIKEVYSRMQLAWMKQDMRLAQHIVTPHLQSHFQYILDMQRRKKIYNYISDIKIKEIRFVGLEDYKNNDLDNFTVYISGYMVDLIVRQNKIPVRSVEETEFEDLYHFVRSNREWRVSEISTTADIWTMASLNIAVE